MTEEAKNRRDFTEGYNGPSPATSQLEDFRPTGEHGYNGPVQSQSNASPPPPPPPKK